MGRSYKVGPPPANKPNLKFGLLFLGNFKTYESFRLGMLGKNSDGNFCFVEDRDKYFLTIADGKITDEERRHGPDNKREASGTGDITNRDLPSE